MAPSRVSGRRVTTVFVVRTHDFDQELQAWAENLARLGRDIVFVADETQHAVPIPPIFRKLSLTADAIRSMGLAAPPAVGWQCGDYALYLARRRFPEASHFWLIEPDVAFNMTDASAFFDHIDRHPAVDLAAGHFRRAKPSWFWHASMSAFAHPVYRCRFPLVRTSAPALDLMLQRRVELSSRFTAAELKDRPYAWPNDEVFAATTCAAAGLACRDLNAFGQKFYDEKTFTSVLPRSKSCLERNPPDGFVYHPALQGGRFLQKARTLLMTRQRRHVARAFAVFDAQFMRELRAECGPEAAVVFRQDVSDAIASLPQGRRRKKAEIALYRRLQPVLLRLGVSSLD